MTRRDRTLEQPPKLQPGLQFTAGGADEGPGWLETARNDGTHVVVLITQRRPHAVVTPTADNNGVRPHDPRRAAAPGGVSAGPEGLTLRLAAAPGDGVWIAEDDLGG
jgi:hypothetical protein